jgi:hypothetical protein
VAVEVWEQLLARERELESWEGAITAWVEGEKPSGQFLGLIVMSH